MFNYGDLQFVESIMVIPWSEMFVECSFSSALYSVSVLIHACVKMTPSLSDVLKGTNCTFQEVDDIFRLAGGSAVYDEFFFCKCALEFVCAFDHFARLTTRRITFFTLTSTENKNNNKITVTPNNLTKGK